MYCEHCYPFHILTQIRTLDLFDVHTIDNDTFSNLTDLQYLKIRMGNSVFQQTLIKVFQSLDVFRDKNMTDLDINKLNFKLIIWHHVKFNLV
jgi:hypothetical protein